LKFVISCNLDAKIPIGFLTFFVDGTSRAYTVLIFVTCTELLPQSLWRLEVPPILKPFALEKENTTIVKVKEQFIIIFSYWKEVDVRM
jgi:hypothetical protein